MIAVTGAAGFIGSNIVWKLNQAGREDIIVVDVHATDAGNANLEPLKYDRYLEKDAFMAWLVDPDNADRLETVYHMGACSSTTETDAAYLAPELAKKKSATGIRISKTLLEQEISTEQAKKLFTEGKTDLLTDFVSKKKGKRKFSAFLKLNLETGKIDWEFPPRAKKAAKKKSAKKKTANANEGAE